MSPENIPGLSVSGARLTIRLGEPPAKRRRPGSARRGRRLAEAVGAQRKAA